MPGISDWGRCLPMCRVICEFTDTAQPKLQKQAFSAYKCRHWIIVRAPRGARWCYPDTRAERASWTHARSAR